MPFFNRRGQAATGVDGIVGYDGIAVLGKAGKVTITEKPALGAHWYDDDTLIYQTYDLVDNHAFLETYNIVTKQRTKVADMGANHIIAGGGRFAAWLDHVGVFGAITNAVAGVAAAGRDGTLAIIPVYQNDVGLLLYAPDGRVTEIKDVIAYLGLQVLGPSQAIWHGVDNTFQTLNLFVPVQAAPGWDPRIGTVKNEDWVTYWTDKFGLITHPTHTLEGYILRPAGTKQTVFNHDVVTVDGRMKIAWSNTQGERPEDLVSFFLDTTKPRTKFDTGFIPPIPSPFRGFSQTATGGGVVTDENTSALVQAQLGLLEDDIVYRLALLAVNVLQPLKNRYPNIVIKSGFRQVNTGAGQHELGEAVDIQIVNQTPELLYEVANWMKNHLAFDQLILNFSNIGDGQPWIHVSFSPKSLRQQVITKDFSDTFHQGLYFIEPLTGEEAAQALRDQDALNTRIADEMEKISKRSAKLLTGTSVQDEVPDVPGTGALGTGASGGGTGTGSANKSEKAKLVACVQKALGLKGTPSAGQENVNAAFEVTKRVAWLLKDEGCGLLVKKGGANIVAWNGNKFSAGRVCYPDGQIYKILTGVEDGPQGGGHHPEWSDNGTVDPSLYVPAMDPGPDINLNWLNCAFTPSSNTSANTAPAGGGGPDAGRDHEKTV